MVCMCFLFIIRPRQPMSNSVRWSAASEVYKGQLLGELDDVFTPVGFHVTPVLGRVAPETLETLCVTPEVAQIITPTLAELRALPLVRERRTLPDGTEVPLYRYPWRGFDIWGMTARVLHDLLEQGPG